MHRAIEPPLDASPFVRRSRRLAAAYGFARDAHDRRRRVGGSTIDHPAAVAKLLYDAGYPEHVVISALLHDVVEDTATGLEELCNRFGEDVGSLVATLTENPRIREYPRRKAELRDRAATRGHHAAAIFAADKLASARALNAAGVRVPSEKIEHYQHTVHAVRAHHPEVPFLDWLDAEIARLRLRSPA